MRRTALLALLLLGPMSACGYKGPALAGYDGLGYQVKSYYDRYAIEKNGSCNAPEMSIAGTRVVEDTADRLVLSIKYGWQDTQYATEDPFTGARRSFGVGSCNGFGERQFTIQKVAQGEARVIDMSGDRRDR